MNAPAAKTPVRDADLTALVLRHDRRLPRYTSYPTAPQFTADIGRQHYRSWLRSLPRGAALSLYIHIPFCHELCLYCGCHTTAVRRYSPVAAYVETLKKEIEIVARLLGEGRPVSHIHWGGGTPTILAPLHLRDISRTIARYFNIKTDAEIAIEIDPRSLTPAHVEALAAIGVNRASLGVQDLDQKVQQAIGRIQTFEQTAEAADRLRRAGIGGMNIDLMYGLPYQTVDSVARSTAIALELGPDRIAVFGYAHVPWMKRHQALLPEASLPGTVERFHQMQAASEAIKAAGYDAIGLDHFAKPTDPLALALAERRLHRNFQGYTTDQAAAIIAFGTSSIGRLPQGYVQNASRTLDYNAAISAGKPAIARGVALSPDDRFRASVIEQLMCFLTVDLQSVALEHGADADDLQAELAAIDHLADEGIVTRRGSQITVPEHARPFLRSVCAVFDRYLSREGARYSRAV